MVVGPNAAYNLSYNSTFANGVQVAGKELPSGVVVNSISVGISSGLQLTENLHALSVTGFPILLNGNNLTIGLSASQPGSLNNQIFGSGSVTRWFGTAAQNHGTTATINFAAGTPASPQSRAFSISTSSITQGGTITVRHTDAEGQTAFSQPFFENTFGYVRRSNAGWQVSTGNGLTIGNVQVRLGAQGIFGNEPSPFIASNMSLADGVAPGTFVEAQNTSTHPLVRRDFASHTDLNNTFYIAERDPLLPIKNLVLRGTTQGKKVNLTWESTGEENLSHYEIERSNGGGFTTIAKVNAANAAFMQYAFTDAVPPSGSVRYRVAAIDSKDGKAHYSQIIQLMVDNSGAVLLQNYPNPASGNTRIDFTIDQRAKVALRVVSTTGQVSRLVELGNREAGTHPVLLNVSDMSPGIYFYQLIINGALLPDVKRMVIQ
jgi:hypothetical protein